MSQRPVWSRLGVLLVIVVLGLTACRAQEEEAAPAQAPAGDEEQEEAAAGEIATDVGVTEDPCPNPVNPDNGCIFLGTISDLTSGPFAALAGPITEAQKAFWHEVNEAGGIAGRYDVDVTTYVRDNKYNPEVHKQVFQEIEPNVLALAQTLGSPTTAAIIDDLRAKNIVAAPASWTSAWEFEDVIVESGTNYCLESMDAIAFALDELGLAEGDKVMAVHYAGDYGNDAAAGAKIAAEENGLQFVDVQTTNGPENQAGAIDALVTQEPELVILTTGPTDAGAILGQAAARGFSGKVIGTSPTWNPALLQSPAAEAFKNLYFQSAPWQTFTADTPGHERMREALPNVQPNDGYTSGWAWSYPLHAALERAAENGDLTRAGVVEAVRGLEDVDYEGMLPESAGRFAGEPNETVFRQAVISKPDDSSPTGVTVVRDFFAGPTAENFEFTQPCFELLSS